MSLIQLQFSKDSLHRSNFYTGYTGLLQQSSLRSVSSLQFYRFVCYYSVICMCYRRPIN